MNGQRSHHQGSEHARLHQLAPGFALYGIEPLESFTAWLALSPATGKMNCMRFLPGSHQRGLLDHADTNMLTRGQTVRDGVGETQAVAGLLKAGQMSIHHGLTLHASELNRSDSRRIGLAMRFLRPGARQTKGDRDYAALVRGRDTDGHFLPMSRPKGDLIAEAITALRHTPFDNVGVRLAIKYGLDREALIEKVLGGHATLGNDNPINATCRFFDAEPGFVEIQCELTIGEPT